MDDLSRFCCQNSECPDHGQRGAGNLTVCDHYGPNNARRMLRCRTCKSRFSERKGTIFFGATLPEEQIASVMEHIGEGCGVRKTGRLVGVHRVVRLRPIPPSRHAVVNKRQVLLGQHFTREVAIHDGQGHPTLS